MFMRQFVHFAVVLLSVAAPCAAADAELGRLFLTPQQRQDLDRRRASNQVEEQAPQVKQVKEGPLILNGHIQRSGGKSTTWINGAPENDSHASRDPARITIAPNEGEAGIELKIGQTYERDSHELIDQLQGGEIRVQKTPGPAANRARR